MGVTCFGAVRALRFRRAASYGDEPPLVERWTHNQRRRGRKAAPWETGSGGEASTRPTILPGRKRTHGFTFLTSISGIRYCGKHLIFFWKKLPETVDRDSLSGKGWGNKQLFLFLYNFSLKLQQSRIVTFMGTRDPLLP